MNISNFFNSRLFTSNFTFTKQIFSRLNLPKVQNSGVPKVVVKTGRQPNYDTSFFNGTRNRMPVVSSVYSPLTQTETASQTENGNMGDINSLTGLFYIRKAGADYTEQDAIAYQLRKTEKYQTALSALKEQFDANKEIDGVTELITDPFVPLTKEEYDAFVEQLRTNGIDKEIDWQKISVDFNFGFVNELAATISDPLNNEISITSFVHGGTAAISENRIDMLASTYAVLEARIKSDFSGDEQVARLEKLHQFIYDAIEYEAEAFANEYGSVYDEKELFKNSIINAYSERIDEYRSYIADNEDYSGIKGTETEWLYRDDSYMAQKLRNAEKAGRTDTVVTSSNSDYYSLNDLKYAAQAADLINNGLDRGFNWKSEAGMGLDLAMLGMKIETFCDSGLVGDKMADTIRKAFNNSIEKHIKKTQNALAELRDNPKIAGDKQGYSMLVEKHILDVFKKTMDAFLKTNDALKALQQGAEYGKQLFTSPDYISDTANTYRYSGGKNYFNDFYNDIIWRGGMTGINGAIGRVSAFQQYTNDWNSFIENLNEGKLSYHRNDYSDFIYK